MNTAMASDRSDDLLNRIGELYGTDKVYHGFLPFYDRYLRPGRKTVGKVLEIGIHGGSSLYMWRDYFPNAVIHGVDIKRVDLDNNDRITTHIADQEDRIQLQDLIALTGSDFDLIVDDGGHTMGQQQTSLGFLFPQLRAGGFYILEDLHTSFIERIDLYKDGVMVGHYDTGVGKCSHTAFEVIDRLSKHESVESEFMTAAERNYLASTVQWVEVFDRDGDRKHMTCVIRKKPLTLFQKFSAKILNKLLG